MKNDFEKFQKVVNAFKDTITKSQESLNDEMKNNNATLKKDIKDEVIIEMDTRLNDKLNAIT